MKGFIESLCNAEGSVYTKIRGCAEFESAPLGIIIHDRDVSYTLKRDEFDTEIKNGITAPGPKRITPLLWGLTDFQVSGGDVRTSQEGFGRTRVIGINTKSIVLIYDEGGLCLFKQLKKLNGRLVRVFLVDNQLRAYGTAFTKDDVDKFRGFLAEIAVTRRDNTGTQSPAVLVTLYFDATYEQEEKNISGFLLSEQIEGLSGLVLKKTGTGKAKVIASCSLDDITAIYNDDIANPLLYVNGMGVRPTTVGYNAATEDLTFTPLGIYKVADAAALAAVNIEGYEGEDEFVDLL
jgi:hypothetical protein